MTSPVVSSSLSVAGAARQLARNSARTLTGVTHNLMQNPTLITRNSLIVSTLILVLSRIGITFQSANKTKGTPEASFRRKEAIKTTFREACGWTVTYGLFRGIENLTRKIMRDYFGIEKQTHGLGLSNLKHELGYALRREKSHFKGVKPIELVDNYQFGFTQTARYEKLKPAIDRLFKALHLNTTVTDATARLKGLYKWAPVVAATIPTVLLSGVVLERYARDHADNLAENLSSKWHAGFDPASGGGVQNPVPTPSPGGGSTQAYNAFMNQAQQQQRPM